MKKPPHLHLQAGGLGAEAPFPVLAVDYFFLGAAVFLDGLVAVFVVSSLTKNVTFMTTRYSVILPLLKVSF